MPVHPSHKPQTEIRYFRERYGQGDWIIALLRQGYLKVYSAIGEFKDGDAWYFPHSSYEIYTIGGKLLKNVGNHISRGDEIPEIVALPVGFYTVVARAEKAGYIRVPVVINEGQQTILDLDVWESKTLRQFAHK